MINTQNKFKIVFIGFIVMTILNLVILGMLWFNRPGLRFKANQNIKGSYPIQRIFVDRLDLTDEQSEQFKKMRTEYRIKMRTIVDHMQDNRNQMYSLIGKADSIQVDSLAAAIADDHKKIAVINFNHFEELKTLLDEEQKEKFDRMIKRTTELLRKRRQVLPDK